MDVALVNDGPVTILLDKKGFERWSLLCCPLADASKRLYPL